MGNPCGQVHMPNMPCRACDRARKDALRDSSAPPEVLVSATGDDLPDEPERESVEPGSKADRLATAKRALTAAERAAKYRAKKREDPEWLKREAARKREERRK